MKIQRTDVYVLTAVMGAYAAVGNIPPAPDPCCGEVAVVREDGSTPVETLDICEKQKVTAVVYNEAGEPTYIKLVYDGDAPKFEEDQTHRLMNGWMDHE